MSAYGFYGAQLRFVVARTDRESADISDMMVALEVFADQVEASSTFEVRGDKCRITGRALAGVAGFLQQHILPETLAAGNPAAERQVRWVIDTSMGLTARLTVHAETATDEGVEATPCPVALPEPPEADG